jgi:catechol 2,3-dioxygenase-like lactoylglutathione lyase family enzyme
MPVKHFSPLPKLHSVVLYVRSMDASIAFYEKHFGYVAKRFEGDRLIELHSPNGGMQINLHQAAKSLKRGQVLVKLGFAVENVAGFVAHAAANGLKFGALHKAQGYVFANAKDPDGNSIGVSSRVFRLLS